MEKAIYLTDDRDRPEAEQRALVIFPGGNGDWYVQVAPAHGRTTEGVRLCTSGGASSQCPGLTSAIAMAYRAMIAAQNGTRRIMPSYDELEREVQAWRSKANLYEFDELSGQIIAKEI